MSDIDDFHFMQRALDLARSQAGRTAPNPSVGCVIVVDGVVIAQGATGDGGRPHAEETALATLQASARGATAYVTLEPCNQRSAGGRSCTDLLIAAGVARVVYASADPHALAAGIGPHRLRAAGVVVDAGLCAAEADGVNADFFARVAAGDA
jgi:pyrimidine deaminase RibD-like protein